MVPLFSTHFSSPLLPPRSFTSALSRLQIPQRARQHTSSRQLLDIRHECTCTLSWAGMPPQLMLPLFMYSRNQCRCPSKHKLWRISSHRYPQQACPRSWRRLYPEWNLLPSAKCSSYFSEHRLQRISSPLSSVPYAPVPIIAFSFLLAFCDIAALSSCSSLASASFSLPIPLPASTLSLASCCEHSAINLGSQFGPTSPKIRLSFPSFEEIGAVVDLAPMHGR